eukprot:340934_1
MNPTTTNTKYIIDNLFYSNDTNFTSSVIVCKYIIDYRYLINIHLTLNILLYIDSLTLKLAIACNIVEGKIMEINTALYETTNNYILYSNNISQNRYKNDGFYNSMVNKNEKNK